MSIGIPLKPGRGANAIPISVEYEGKKDASDILAKPFGEYRAAASANGGGENRFFFGDNLDAMLFLLNNGGKSKIRLIYADPPFSTSARFLNDDAERAYDDALRGAEHIEFLRERLIAMRELLADDGSIYLHLDGNAAFAMKLVMDEIFGAKNCRAFVTRKKCASKNWARNTFGNVSDYVMFYSKTDRYVWNRPYAKPSPEKISELYPNIDEKTGRRYMKAPLHAPGARNGATGMPWRGILPPNGKHWQCSPAKLDELDAAGEIYRSPTGNLRRKVFYDPDKGMPIQNIWLDYRDSANQAQLTTGYPTEKNRYMLRMIVSASSNPGDTVMDAFAGGGTTLGAAAEANRTWIGMDDSPESVKAVIKRFVVGLEPRGERASTKNAEPRKKTVPPTKCAFDIFATRRDAEKISAFLDDANAIRL